MKKSKVIGNIVIVLAIILVIAGGFWYYHSVFGDIKMDTSGFPTAENGSAYWIKGEEAGDYTMVAEEDMSDTWHQPSKQQYSSLKRLQILTTEQRLAIATMNL